MQTFLVLTILIFYTSFAKNKSTPLINTQNSIVIKIDSEQYLDQFHGFWLGQCIANWTGLITEMDKIGNLGDVKTGAFYTRENWGKADQPNIWETTGHIKRKIDFILKDTNAVWGADDDTDLEYMYQHLLYTNHTTELTPEQIRKGWLNHIKKEEENFLWVSNQQAFDLMQKGIKPPHTSLPAKNSHYNMIDAQLSTEIFGLYSPGRPDIGIQLGKLAVQTTARHEAEEIANFYIAMHALAYLKTNLSMKKRTLWMAEEAQKILNPERFPKKMFNYTQKLWKSGISWEHARDSIYYRYQVQQKDGYKVSSQKLYCNGCFAAGINFASSLVSLFYGEGDLKQTIKIGTLMGWDSDNPTATWGGLLGFMMGKDAIEQVFKTKLSNKFHIHRTRQNFILGGIDTFENMAQKGVAIATRVIQEKLNGWQNPKNKIWQIPPKIN